MALALAAVVPQASAERPREHASALDAIRREATQLRAKLRTRHSDERLRERMADLAVRAAQEAEAAHTTGNGSLIAAWGELIPAQFGDTRWRLGKRAQGGDGAAAYALGVLARHGVAGKAVPEREACSRFEQALDLGHVPARFRAGECLVASDTVRAEKLLREAAGDGHALAGEILAQRCLKATPRDAECARKWLAGAAAAGRPSSQALLAWMYAQGIGGKADPDRAARLYLLAARAGEASAQNNMGELYETGRGVSVEREKAIYWYRKAAEAGFAPGQYNYGRALASGLGTERDFTAAKPWLEKAEAAGIQQARALLDWLARENVKK